MSTHFKAARLPDGVSLSGAVSSGSAEDSSLRIEEPLRFHRARYEHLTMALHGKFNLASAVVTSVILIVLGWKAGGGEHISPERWLCGVLSGWFIVSMFRVALFTWLAAPRFICCAEGRLRVSGAGCLRNAQILHWSIEHKVLIQARTMRGARLQICYRWLGWERQWTMLMEEGPQTERLQRLLEAQLPHAANAAAAPVRRTIQIEAGMLSH